jgi:hypothetical protein
MHFVEAGNHFTIPKRVPFPLEETAASRREDGRHKLRIWCGCTTHRPSGCVLIAPWIRYFRCANCVCELHADCWLRHIRDRRTGNCGLSPLKRMQNPWKNPGLSVIKLWLRGMEAPAPRSVHDKTTQIGGRRRKRHQLGITSTRIPAFVRGELGTLAFDWSRCRWIYRNGRMLCNCATGGSTNDGKGLPSQAHTRHTEGHSELATKKMCEQRMTDCASWRWIDSVSMTTIIRGFGPWAS